MKVLLPKTDGMKESAEPSTARRCICPLSGRGIVLALIKLYRYGVSPWMPCCCRFTPTCSSYAAAAVARYGAIRGSWMALCRLARCHPFYRGPLYDPVPNIPQNRPERKDKFA